VFKHFVKRQPLAHVVIDEGRFTDEEQRPGVQARLERGAIREVEGVRHRIEAIPRMGLPALDGRERHRRDPCPPGQLQARPPALLP